MLLYWVKYKGKSVFWSALVFLLLLICIAPDAIAQSYEKDAAKADSVAKAEMNKQKTLDLLSKLVEEQLKNSSDLEIDGLIVNETITKIGRDFYDIFQMKWEAPPFAKNFTLLIKEQPTRGTGAIISVAINDRVIMEQALQPRYDLIEEIAAYATAIVYEHLLEDQLNQQLEAEGKKARELF